MPKPMSRPISAIPEGLARPIPKNRSLHLLGIFELLHQHLTPALCASVYKKVRIGERERKWTFQAIVEFWTTMIIQSPPSITQALTRTRARGAKRDPMWPEVSAEVNAFFEKCSALRADFFRVLYEGFTSSILKDTPENYISWLQPIRKRFPQILAVDGSNLDAVYRRLKMLWAIEEPILPGSITVFYDLFRGVSLKCSFFADAHASEFKRVCTKMNWIKSGSLILGDRLYGVVKFFHVLSDLRLHGLFRRNGALKIKELKVLSKRQGGRSLLEDILVEAGSGKRHPKLILRLIRYRQDGRSLDLLTDVLDPKNLAADEAVSLYGMRWSIERMFLDLKRTLKLHGLYSSHPNLVAQQLYSTLIVYNALRVAQGQLATEANIFPEQISSEKLFPIFARCLHEWAISRQAMIGIQEANPDVKLNEPDWKKMGFASIRLRDVLLHHRNPHRVKSKGRGTGRWKSYREIPGGEDLIGKV